jgi:trans-2,3-dihydro-3-hydroxyanthranilate isomerase
VHYRYFICDVFTETRFGGNPLLVVPEAEGLTDERMQQIAREFNFSESTFVFPARAGHTCRVRIFTPVREVPFAGHPNVGTAFALAAAGAFGAIEAPITVTFEERAGVVPVVIRRRDDGRLSCELSAPQPLSLGPEVPAQAVAAAVSLLPEDILVKAHAPRLVSVGLPFIVAELASRAALERARIRMAGFDDLSGLGVTPDIHLYVRSHDDFDIRARMFAPLDGVPEDPATGSANCALAGLLSHLDPAPDGTRRWRIAQGVEMGRPSLLEASADKRGGTVVATRIGGVSVLVAEGRLEVD